MPLDNLLPRNRVHLLSGIRDVGKTSFILPAMIDWQNAPDVPLIAGYGKDHKDWATIKWTLQRLKPIPEIVIIEAFQDLTESINKRNIVHAFMNEIDACLHPQQDFPKGLTVVGITGSPKQSKKDRYPDPTQRVPGTSIWVERASTIFVLDSAEANLQLTTERRIMHVCRKAGARLVLDGAFTVDNRLIFPNL
jgi:hypothetical protein